MANDLTEKDSLLELFRSDDIPKEKILCPQCLKSDNVKLNEICFFKIDRLTFDEEYPHREAFENVLQALDNDAFNFVYILNGDANGIELYIGVVKNQNENVPFLGKLMNAANYGRNIVGAFEGNFGGSRLEKLTGENLIDIVFDSAKQFKNAGVILGIPSVNKKDNDSKYGFQGIDRLINGMLGLKWRLVVVCEPVAKTEVVAIRNSIYDIYNRVSPYARRSVQQSKSGGLTFGTSTTESTAKGTNRSESRSHSDSNGRQDERTNSSHSDQNSDSFGESTTKTRGSSNNISGNFGKSDSLTTEIVNKSAKEILDYIDKELLERVKIGFGKGLFKTSIYYMGEKPTDAERLKVEIMALFQGNNSSYSPLRALPLDVEGDGKVLTSYQSFYVNDADLASERLTLLSRPHFDGLTGLTTYLTASEVSLIAGLPQKEIPGLIVKESVDFGLNFKRGDGSIFLGNLMQHGRELATVPVKLSDAVLNKHTFIAGVTGSGKTTTCHKILTETSLNFFVIEPSTTEYRNFINSLHFDNLVVFTVGDETTAPLRLNPFELTAGESVSSHADMLKATFTSAFPMEASMPQILEEAIYKIYEDKGWDIDTGRNFVLERRAGYRKGDEFRAENNAFPMLADFLVALEAIVDTKGFSDRLRDDYRGSLVSRFSNLTKGSKGALFNCRQSTNFERLLNMNVVVEMENLKSAEDKALLTGFLLTKLSAVIKRRHLLDKNFRHITLIEEAHRLLARVEFGDNGSKRTAVETFTDLLAEVRKYGESLVVVDQIPNKLAPEVLKNTNTKIIHRLFARDDKEAVGDTMLMDDKQKAFLSALETGQAVVFSEGMERPVHVKIQPATDTAESSVSNAVVRERFIKFFGEQHRRAELAQKFFRPTRELLTKLAGAVTANQPLSTETLAEADKFRLKAAQFIEEFDFDEEPTEFLARNLAAEFARREARDKTFATRLEEIFTLLLTEEVISTELFLTTRARFRLFDDVKRTF